MLCSRISCRCATKSSFARPPSRFRSAPALPLGLELLEDLDLVLLRLDVDRQKELAATGLLAPNGGIEAGAIPRGVVGLEGAVAPVLLEDRPEFREDGVVVDLREPHVPFQTVEHRRVRQVRGPDTRRGEAAVAMEQPCLCVKACPLGVVRDLHLGPEGSERIQRASFRRAHVCGGQDAQARGTTLEEGAESILDHAEAAPLQEGTEKIDRVCGRELAHDLGAESQIVATVDEELARRQRNLGPNRRRDLSEVPRGRDHGKEPTGGRVDVITFHGDALPRRRLHLLEKHVRQGDLPRKARGVVGVGNRPQRSNEPIVDEPREQIRRGFGVEGLVECAELGRQRGEELGEGFADEAVVDAGDKLAGRHCGRSITSVRRALS
jgi:hypothetical protein